MVADGDVPPWWAGHQQILNVRAVPERYTRCEPIPVRVRLRWADDGEEVITTTAAAWTTPLVLVLVEDRARSPAGSGCQPGTCSGSSLVRLEGRRHRLERDLKTAQQRCPFVKRRGARLDATAQ